ncbi:conserved hypothetical protein [Ricinus communis]|uniref:Uncharacterized protein n=1 Tax=Ricinus communis TaxID=3988 RepID=B9TKR0_RICCO|nr:conserved hypothetical protein [Ricinus communis]
MDVACQARVGQVKRYGGPGKIGLPFAELSCVAFECRLPSRPGVCKGTRAVAGGADSSGGGGTEIVVGHALPVRDVLYAHDVCADGAVKIDRGERAAVFVTE